jgi:carbamoyltransferase
MTMNVLGVSCFSHDAAAALICDGDLVAAAAEERFTRRKHDPSYPARAIDFCLRQARIGASDLDLVVFFERPFVKFERIVTSAITGFPATAEMFKASMREWVGERLWIRTRIARHLRIPEKRVLFCQHHMSHAASAFLCAPFEQAAILCVDGVGEWATATYSVGSGSSIRQFGEIRYPHSLGLLYGAFTSFLGFEPNDGEGKVMAMAAYGEPRYLEQVWKLVSISRDGSLRLNMDYFSFHRSSRRMYSEKFVELFGRSRRPAMPFFTEASGIRSSDRNPDFSRRARLNQHYADIAASIQAVTEEVVVRMAKFVRRATEAKNLCMAGGVAFNSAAMMRVVREAGFEQVFIQPEAGDGGGALGAALWGYHCAAGGARKFHMHHACWGEEHAESRAADYLRGSGVSHFSIDDEDELVDYVAEAIADGAVVGWSQGRFEWGPRALGNRSILADPRRAGMDEIVNRKIKLRESFRPFAPALAAEHFGDYFEPAAIGQPGAGFMMLSARVRPDARKLIPAAIHVDGSARSQAVRENDNPLFHRLLTRFGEFTGVPALLNTSFNLRGEPIVNTPEEAMHTFMQSGMDLLVIGNHVVEKRRARLAA